MPIKSMDARIDEIKQETHDTKSFRFYLGEVFDFIPGQFIMLTVFLPNEETRAFSITSSPSHNYIEIVVKKIEGGLVSTYLVDRAKVGEKVIIKGPYGIFTYNGEKNIVLLGAGSGIAPFMSMLRYIDEKRLDTNAIFIYSNKTPNDIIFYKELLEIQKRNKNMHFHFTITRPEGYEWNGLTGRIDAEMIKNLVKELHSNIFYICGPPAMVLGTENILKELGVEKKNIKVEKYG